MDESFGVQNMVLIRVILLIGAVALIVCSIYFIIKSCKQKNKYFRPIISVCVTITYICLFFASITVPFHNVKKSNLETAFYEIKNDCGEYEHKSDMLDLDDYGYKSEKIDDIEFRIKYASETSCSNTLSCIDNIVDKGKIGNVEYWITGVQCLRFPFYRYPEPAMGEVVLFDGTYTVWIWYIYYGEDYDAFPFFASELFYRPEVDLGRIVE